MLLQTGDARLMRENDVAAVLLRENMAEMVVGREIDRPLSLSALPTTMSQHPETLDRAGVEHALATIAPLIHKTPVFRSSSLSPPGTTLLFKAENLQRGGAFKSRGASYNLARLAQEEEEGGKARAVCTHSSGNHASCLALAASQRGMQCYVVMVCICGSSPAQPLIHNFHNFRPPPSSPPRSILSPPLTNSHGLTTFPSFLPIYSQTTRPHQK
jgi:hypothetical protein